MNGRQQNSAGQRTNGAAIVRSEVVAAGVVVAALILFVSTGSESLRQTWQVMEGLRQPNKLVTIALLLNIALILLSWRRHANLRREIAAQAAAVEQANLLAQRDPLTGFYNRRALFEQGERLLERAARRQKPVAMLLLDLDHFKNVNDVHGHAVGDALLLTVAEEVSKLLPPSVVAARLGGDEFACVFPHDSGDASAVEHIVRAIISRLVQPFQVQGTCVHISVSIGISQSAPDCGSIDALMRRADIAMYAAKQGGRNRHAWFDMSMERELQARTETEAGLRAGIPRGEFVPYFEQQVDLQTGRLQGFEVLARWEHPSRGVIPPDEFLTVAEESGMIADLSLAVMRRALTEARDWDPSLLISVNIAPSQLKDPWFAQKIVKLLAETRFPAERLEVEITETSLFENLVLAQSIATSLKNQGIRLALDDFGTGYSSLGHLRALPFDRIKIDRSFVTSVTTNVESAAIVSAIARLGESLGLPVTAEGIEDAGIEERLRQLGCHRGQGWLYGRPIPIVEVRSLLAQRGLLPNSRVSVDEQAPARQALY